MGPCGGIGDGEPKAGAFLLGGVEGAEDIFKLMAVKTPSGVFDLDDEPSILLPQPDGYRPLRVQGLQAVFDQVDDGLADPEPVAE